MAYSVEVTPENPTCVVFLLDDSQSMADPFGGDEAIRKIDIVMDAMNRKLQELAWEIVSNYPPSGVSAKAK